MSPDVTVDSSQTGLEDDQKGQWVLVPADQRHRDVPSPLEACVSVDSFCHKDTPWQLAHGACKLGLESFSDSMAFSWCLPGLLGRNP